MRRRARPPSRAASCRRRARRGAGEAEPEAAPLIKEADLELEKLLDEEEDIARRTHDAHEAPHFRGDEDVRRTC